MTKKSETEKAEIRAWERERKRVLRAKLRARGWVKAEFYAPANEVKKLRALAAKLKAARDE